MGFHKNNQGDAVKSVRFKRSMLAMCVMALSAPSFAQDAPKTDDAVEEVIITGQRANLQSAQEIKRNASTFVDSISSEDIGSLPDRSVLEAMQRIPGISIERFAAANDPDHFGVEGSGAVIRGMSQTRSEFNGRDSFTANSGRGLSFQDVPPELMSGVDVFKNQSADMIEGGIGGTVSLRTRKPFDQPGRQLAFTADVSYGDMAEEFSPTASLLYSDRWETDAGEFGVLVNVTNSKLKGASHGIQSGAYVGYLDNYAANGNPWGLSGDGLNNPAKISNLAGAEAFAGKQILMPNGSDFRMKNDDRTREGYYLDVQWESSDQTLTNNFQFLRSDANLSWHEYAINYQSGFDKRQSVPLAGTQFTFNDQGLFQSGTIVQDGNYSNGGWRSADSDDHKNAFRIPNAADWANPSVPQFGNRYETNTRYKDTTTVVDDFSNTFKWTPNETWEFTLDLQYIKADTVDGDDVVMLATYAIQDYDLRGSSPKLTLIEPWHGLRDNNVGGKFGVAGAGAPVGGITYTGFTDDTLGDSNFFQDPANYYWRSAMDHYERSEGDSKAVRFDTTYHMDDDAGLLKSIKAGVRFADREQTVRDSGYQWGGVQPEWNQPQGWIGNQTAGTTPEQQAKSLYGQEELVDWSNFFRGDGSVTIPGNTMLHPKVSLIQAMIRDNRALQATGDWVPAVNRAGVVDGPFKPSDIFITQEKNQAAYVRFDFGADIGEHELKGNVGLRYVELTRTATGSVRYPDVLPDTLPPAGAPSVLDVVASDAWEALQLANFIAANPGTNAQSQSVRDYMTARMKFRTDAGNFLNATELGFGNNGASVESSESVFSKVLPSLNLAYNITDDLIGRFAWSKALALPDMADVRNTTSLGAFETLRQVRTDASVTPPKTTMTGASINGWRGTSGNPALSPMQSDQMDVSLEWYFAKSSSLTFTLFKKDLTDFWVSGSFDRVYTNPTSGVTQPALVEGTVNAGEGTIEGIEFAYTQFFDMLPAPFDGLGVQYNYSYIDSANVPNQGGRVDNGIQSLSKIDFQSLPLKGQSKQTYNVAVMYEKDDWSARLAYNWRSKYLLTANDVITQYPLWNDESGFLDGSVSYKINDKLNLGLQFTNLLNTQTKTIFILDGKSLEAGRSWFENDRRAAVTLKGVF